MSTTATVVVSLMPVVGFGLGFLMGKWHGGHR